MSGTNHPMTQEQITKQGLHHYAIIFITIPYMFLPVPIQHIGTTSSDYTSFFTLISFFFMLGKTMGRFGIW
jgi:hypothetical protein